ncbi:TonB-dependent outer membrane receptor, SusC/RagA subfamily, signature region [Lutibacter agarilyticus]|uniref:TonB-dependent outer membrane receptor, SusC/RagA subfamily, signature region n=1 Tax=Lutibacter agarilyticus TaxID=1109740 RepID=A0A238WJR5_9FLAO|nr:carboxypeptidase-like regulatory domain-containing protein [Lutibacter agarilyticus]SNR45909.1 TonB-dependent outer membrane receptor, SusC/RagA subfamily, signature region [Lutibacter agarilyticus]
MKKIITLLISIVFILQNTQAQKSTKYYEKSWKEVQQFELENLPKSALIIVDEIYSKAKKEENSTQTIKAIIYKSKFALTLEEEAQLSIINSLKKEISEAKFPTKNILQSVLANLYWQYFQQNRYKFYKRTKNTEKIDSTDFRTWDLNTIFTEIHTQYQHSLENGLVSQLTKLKTIDALLTTQKDSKKYRPTLFDFLSHNALDFYKTNETHITVPSYKFELNDPQLIANFNTFSSYKIKTKDTLSLQLNALAIYKKLISFHKKGKNNDALIAIDLERLEFVKNNAVFKNKDSLYVTSLIDLKNEFSTIPSSTLIDFNIATEYHKLGNDFVAGSTTKNQFKRVEAIKICNEAIAKFPESLGAKKCTVLKQQIEHISLQLTAEENIPSNSHSKILVNYKNINKLYFNIYEVTPKQKNKFYGTYNDEEKIGIIKGFKLVNNFKQVLKTENDFQNHTTEVVIPPLENGQYLIIASEEKSVENNKLYASTFIQATNFAITENYKNNMYTYQVVDRNTGKPFAYANVNFKNYNTSRYNKTINEDFITDAKGQLQFTTNHYHRNVLITVKKDSEKGIFGDYYIIKYRNTRTKDKKTIITPFLFTDRSIYRPGQTVFFKGIFVKNVKEDAETYANKDVKVSLYNANREKIKELKLNTNEFGAINGAFILPNNGLLGRYSILLEVPDWRTKSFYFSVEEYKRPKFETTFKPITAEYKVNDTVTIQGNAIAFTGSTISNAKVTYRVQRKVEYPRWYYWNTPNYMTANSQEITFGETTTDEQGNYDIQFKAIPDSSVNKENLPIFNYEISADVTDINGETHSTTSTIKVGYHALVATIKMPEKLDKTQSKNTITIETKNLNGELVSANGTLKIYKLQAPQNVLRKRPWKAPDYKLLSEEEFSTKFPHESFSNNDNPSTWKKGVLEFSNNFDTSKNTEIQLPKIQNWTSGRYIVELNTNDKFGQLVTEKKTFTVFSENDKTISDNKLFTISTNKASYKPLENVNLSIGSASKDLYVTIDVEKNKKVISTQIIHLNNEIKEIEIPVTEKDLGGFAIHYSYTNYNSFESNTITVSVPYPSKELTIETLSFRDKLQPSSNETWSFKIKGSKGEKIAAELLASMYDASLDQFKPHSWDFKPIQHQYYSSSNRRSARNSFDQTSFSVRNIPYLDNSINNTQYYDQFNWFGFSFRNNWQIRHQYLESIREPIITKTTYDASKEKGFVYGTVYDSDSQPLPGVSILIKGTSTGVSTDFDGNFKIAATKGNVLIFTYIGFESSSIKISKNNIYKIVLSESSASLDEVIVVGYGTSKRRDRTGSVVEIVEEDEEIVEDVAFYSERKASEVNGNAEIKIRGLSSIANTNQLIIVDGVIYEGSLESIESDNIASINILKDAAATALYGAKAANGVIIISTKSGQEKVQKELANVKARKNFNETAFFYPNLRTDEKGVISFNFTMPEALTRWKFQLLAHTKELATATKTLTTVTQKELMVLPNPPRFLRESDEIVFSSKVSNLSDNPLNGVAQLVLTDAITGKEITKELLKNTTSTPLSGLQNFTVNAKGNTNVNWTLTIPHNVQAVQYKIVAKAGDFSDGEQNVLPVLSNRMLVTETLPMWVRSNQTKTFTLDKLLNIASTPLSDRTLKNHKLTLEITSNPAWYAVQSLPYLMEYPYECAEQTFARFYANSLASHIANSNPRIQEVFNLWKTSDALISNLEKNEELKSIIIQETPWLRDAQNENEQKKRIGLLFDLNKMKNEQETALNKLKQLQFNDGGFPWFKGSRTPNRYITQHIAASYGHLKQLWSLSRVEMTNNDAQKMIEKAVQFLDNKILEDYNNLLKQAKKIRDEAKTKAAGIEAEKAYLAKKQLNNTQLHYLYMRSFYKEVEISSKVQKAVAYYTTQSATYWKEFNLYSKGLIALIQHRNSTNTIASKIVASLKENSITNEEMGMYWKENTASWYWYQSPIETQALLIEVFSEIENDIATVDELKVWLLKNKQTTQWKTTKATTEAVYALLLQGSDWLSVNESVEVTVGTKKIEPSKLENVQVEAGTGYYKTSWNSSEITSEMAKITISKKDEGIAWGGLYWQYFEDLDKITSAETPLKLSKKLFIKSNSDTGKILTEITEASNLKLGDLITVRIELKVDRPMEYVHLKDMRASGLEPINVLSSYKWQDGLGYYESTKDASTNFFMERLPKGVYVFEYDLRVNNAGNFSNGITTIQSMYAPEFSSHSEGVRIKVGN